MNRIIELSLKCVKEYEIVFNERGNVLKMTSIYIFRWSSELTMAIFI